MAAKVAAASAASCGRLFFLFVALVVALVGLTPAAAAAAAAAGCDATQLAPCAPAIVGNASPTAACCGKLKAHPAGCFCRYKKDPKMRRYVGSPNGKKVFAACKVPLPRC